jgi:hypothetical protein
MVTRLRPGAQSIHQYADRKLLTPAMIARIETIFHLPADRTEVQRDLHYQSKETPNVLGTRSSALKDE